MFRMNTFLASLAVCAFLLAGGATAASTNTQETTTANPALTSIGPAPSGLVVVIKDVPEDASLDLRALSNPYISGVALQIHWSDIEPVEGKPDWSKLDALFAAAQTSHKWVQLFIFPGFFSPAWALKGAQTDRFAVQYGPGAGTVMNLPMPWDSVYLNRWFAFLKLLSQRYGTSPAFRVIAADGPTSVSDEATLPRSPQDVTQWQTDGYTTSKYAGAWQQTFPVYSADFPHQYISLSVGHEADILGIDGSSSSRQAIVSDATTLLGRRFALEMNALHAGPDPYPNGPTSKAYDQFIVDYAGTLITGFQMGGGMEGTIGSQKMGAPGNPALALRRSVDLGMEANKAGHHVNYVEIYEPDMLPADMQSVLHDEASRW